MRTLSKELLGSQYPSHLPERVIQFGEGNFIRSFVDWMVHRMNRNGLFGGRIVVVQPIAEGLVSRLNDQDGLFTVLLRGIQAGQAREERELVTSISRGINPYTDWDAVLRCAENPAIEFVVSNTTEAGIAHNPADRPCDRPPASFPGKLTAYLHHRYRHFAGDPERGLVIIPCELIDRNGDTLKQVVLRRAAEWGLGDGFAGWVRQHSRFLNTLVDRVVAGYPRDEAEGIMAELGYQDQLLSAAELFHLWVIEGPRELSERLPFTAAGLDVVWTDDVTPYRTRKVRILNGAHTSAVPAAFLCGHETVGEMVNDPLLGRYLREIIFGEIIPSIEYEGGLAPEPLREFACAVLERFQNPYIKHYLTSILLNSVSKYRARVLPSLLGHIAATGRIPPRLSLSLAALIAVYRGRVDGTALRGARGRGEYALTDEPEVLRFFAEAWAECSDSLQAAQTLVRSVLGNTDLWGADLNLVPGLTDRVAGALFQIVHEGMAAAVRQTLGAE